LIYGIGPISISVWIAIAVSALWGFYTPAAQSIMTQTVSPTEQGRLQGALGSLMGLAAIISPPLYTNVLASAIEAKDAYPDLPIMGAPFFLAAFLLMCALAAATIATRPHAEAKAVP
jgi:DHA1 family tetracycline resistance protein-like MFS transporter